jgi:formylglycine-generating enzyme required for sulfatase activity
MAGNVWEWTRSRFADYPYDTRNEVQADLTADATFLLLRGGSWSFIRGGARCAIRSRDRPGYRFYGIGFRVVLRSSPVL